MINWKLDQKGKVPKDNSDKLSKAEKDCVLAALSWGLEEFTVPTPDDDENSTAWAATRWVAMEDGKPVCYMVAYRVDNAHFMVVGPKLQMNGTGKAAPNLERR